MYAPFFGLKHEPFSIAPDPRYLFMSERHREALAHLLYGVNGGGGFVLLSGEIGAGKTTVCRCFLEQIPRRTNVAYIFNPKLTGIELVKSVCDEFRIPYVAREPHHGAGPATVTDYLDPLNQFLLKTHAVGSNNVLIIDEAQSLSADVLEQLRLMTNLETSERKLLQIILIGQPELRDMLAQPGMQQLAQRVIARFHLDALSERETAQYIQHRLAVAGMTGPIPFGNDTLKRIHHICRGVPRRINLLCDRALLGAYAGGKRLIDRDTVDKAAAEVFDGDDRRTGSAARLSTFAGLRHTNAWRWAAAAGVVGLLIGAASFAGGSWWSHRADRAAANAAEHASTGAAQLATPSATAALAESTSGAVRTAAVAPAGGASGAASGGASGSLPGRLSGNEVSAFVGTAAAGSVFDARTAFATLPRDDGDAWRALALRWKANLGDNDKAGRPPCVAAQAQQLPCFRTTTTLAVIRQLDRPGILTLRDANGRAAYALLTGLGADSARLQVGAVQMTASLNALAGVWRGEFATLWRAPYAYRTPISGGTPGPSADALSAQLAGPLGDIAPGAGQKSAGTLQARVAAFQRAQGLEPDGIAGPATLMQLNRALGVDEPRLLRETAVR